VTRTEEVHERAHDEPPAVQTPRLLAKIVEAAAAVGEVAKDGRNAFHKYDYSSIEAVVKAVRLELLSRGVLISPSLDHVETRTRATREGESVITTAYVVFTVFDAETGEQLQIQWAGQGDDPADKGLSKAITDARKTFLLVLLNLARGDDTEADDATDQRSAGANNGGTNLTDEARGLNNQQLNQVLVAAGLPAQEKPWGAFMRVPPEAVDGVRVALRGLR
jgi:hypothetical protein